MSISQERMFEIAAQASNILTPAVNKLREQRNASHLILELFPGTSDDNFMTLWVFGGPGDLVAWTRLSKATSRSGLLEQINRVRARVDLYERSIRRPGSPGPDGDAYIEAPVWDDDGRITEAP